MRFIEETHIFKICAAFKFPRRPVYVCFKRNMTEILYWQNQLSNTIQTLKVRLRKITSKFILCNDICVFPSLFSKGYNSYKTCNSKQKCLQYRRTVDKMLKINEILRRNLEKHISCFILDFIVFSTIIIEWIFNLCLYCFNARIVYIFSRIYIVRFI